MIAMAATADAALANFLREFDEFVTACSEVEATGRWDVKRRGFMSAYFETDLFAVVLQLMSADGVFRRAEAAVLNSMFGTSYTSRDLRKMYVSLKPVIDDYCDADAADALAVLARVDEGLRDAYRRLILDACEVVSLSDGIAEGEEQALIERLRVALGA